MWHQVCWIQRLGLCHVPDCRWLSNPPAAVLTHCLSTPLLSSPRPPLALAPAPSCILPVLRRLLRSFCSRFHCPVASALCLHILCVCFLMLFMCLKHLAVGSSGDTTLYLLLVFSCNMRALPQLYSEKSQGRTLSCVGHISVPGPISGLWLEYDDWSGVEQDSVTEKSTKIT